ncbi:hypothetical protein HYX02_08205 [Candidatus Woesearchaeota archaeon]|nr:hypothetical protein [Candidatus Woesearchaeota archaeon]
MKTKKKIIVDLDAVTVSIWDKKGENSQLATEFIGRIKNKEFYVITPFFLLELVPKWRYSQLKDYIEEFYLKFTDTMLSNEDLDEKIDSINIDDRKVILELISNGIKSEDSLLVLVASIFDADYLITFNRVHLKNKKEAINEVLKKNGLSSIKIAGPEEV